MEEQTINTGEQTRDLQDIFKNWQNVIDEMKCSENFNEDIVLPNEEIQLNFKFHEIGDDSNFDQIIHPKQISIQEQENNMNVLIDKVHEFKEQYFTDFKTRYADKHSDNPDNNIKLNIDDMLLQKNSRAVMSDAHGDLFSLLSALCTIGFVDVSKNHFLYFNLKTKQFVKREDCFQTFNKAIEENKKIFSCIDIFSNHIESFLEIINGKNKTIDVKIKSLNDYIKNKEGISNWTISNEFNKICFSFEKFCVKIEQIPNANRFWSFSRNRNQKFTIKIDDGEKCLCVALKDDFAEYVNDAKQKFEKFKANIFREKISEIFYVIPMLYIKPIALEQPDLLGKFIDLGDCIDRGPETVACLVTYALLSQAIPNSIKCMLGNHEAMQVSLAINLSYDVNFVSLIDFCIENQFLKPGYIESNKIADKKIWRSYSHAILTKMHLPKLFTLLAISSCIASMKSEKVSGEEKISENEQIIMESIKNYGILDLDDFDEMEKHLKNKWPEIFNNFSEELRNKLENFFKDRDLIKSLLDYLEGNNLYGENTFMSWQDFYSKLLEFGFANNEFFELKFALCSIFYNKYYDTADKIWRNVFSDFSGGMGWLFGDRYVPKNKDELFGDVIQYLGHDCANFILMPENLGGLVIYLDVFRSAGYRTEGGLNNESRLNLLLTDITLNDINNYKGIITISGFLPRKNFKIEETSRIIFDELYGKVILNAVNYDIRNACNIARSFDNLKGSDENFVIKKTKTSEESKKRFSSTKLINNILFKNVTIKPLEAGLEVQKQEDETIQKQMDEKFGEQQADKYNQLNSSNIELDDNQKNSTNANKENPVPLQQNDKVIEQMKF